MRALLIGGLAVLPHSVMGSSPFGNSTWASQMVADKSSWGSSYSYDWGNMALVDGRFPVVVYYDETSGSSLRSVEWVDGEKRDESMFPVQYLTSSIRLAAHGGRLALAWRAQVSGQFRLFFSMREDGVWSNPEQLVLSGHQKFALAMTSSGNPVMAVAQEGPASTSEIFWWERGQEGWSSSGLVSAGTALDSIELVLDEADVPTVAWRRKNPSGTTGYSIRYARREASGWAEAGVDGATLLDTLLIDPSGNPAVIGRPDTQTVPLYISLGPGGPSAPEPVTTQTGYVGSAVSLPDGRILATKGAYTLLERDGGSGR